ncbi:hypothetical protein [Flavobacterium sp. 2]|uniref:hypothetical protein n=1 Tax=Flavobacterium sp. 2 TaxID=308053 RepID=UPI000C197EB7|nr:hypothetical protein [Flavobacterium sp. 2]PIF60056.1 hypothetical protein CLU99_3301 [Flavobacterium sp. 2]
MDKVITGIFVRTKRLMEIYIWLFISLLVGGRPFYWGVIRGKAYYEDFFMNFYIEILFAILVFLFPFLFNLIYTEFPFEFLRNKRRGNHVFIELKDDEKSSKIDFTVENEKSTISTGEGSQKLKKEEILLENYLFRSKEIADKLYSRAGAYLLIGCLIAFVGVLFFYFQTTNLHNSLTPILKDLTTGRILFEYLPRIGTLVFVEAIAFFFLKQYRTTMEEFRYYEAIKRQRENQLTILGFFKDYEDSPDRFEKLINSLDFSDNPNKLSKGDSNTIIETSKVDTKDFEVIDKFVELLKLYKK